MVEFKKIGLSEDGKYLIVYAIVKKADYYEEVYLDRIDVYDVDTFKSDTPIYTSPIYDNSKEKIMLIPIKLLLGKVEDNMLFIKITTTGEIKSNCPKEEFNNSTIAVFTDMLKLFKKYREYLHNLDTCNIPKHFIDWLLQLKAFEYSLRVQDFNVAIDCWNRLHKETSVNSNMCGCYG